MSISSDLSSWRSPVSLQGLSQTALKSANMNKAHESRLSSALSCHDTATCLALVGAQNKGSLKIIRVSSNGQEVFPTKLLKTQGPGYDVDWVKNTLLVASNNHSIHLAKTDPSVHVKSCEPSSEESVKWEQTYCLPEDLRLPASYIMPPQKYPATDRINRVSINPNAENIFASIENNSFHIWEIENPAEPFHSDQGSQSLLTCVEWSPHSVNMLSMAGTAKSIKILDTREISSGSQRGVIWKAVNAHKEAIKCIRWNPLIPHWLASSGDDGVVKVWDIRMNTQSPAVSLEGHQNSVNSISWCPIRCEILLTGSSDRSARLWNLRFPPHHLLATLSNDWTDSIIASEFIQGRAQNFVVCSGSGQLRSYELNTEFAKSLSDSRNEKVDETFSDIESLIFMRDYPNAFAKATKLAEKYVLEGKIKETEALLAMCETESRTDVETFQEQIEAYSKTLPPNLPLLYSPKRVNAEVLTKLKKMKEHMEFKQKLFLLSTNQDIEGLLGIEKTFFEKISEDKNAVDMKLITGILLTFLSNDYLKGLQAGLRYAEVMLKNDMFEEYATINYILLHPTIYDDCNKSVFHPDWALPVSVDEAGVQSIEAVRSKLKDPSVVNSQITLLCDVYTASLEQNTASQIIKLMDGKKASTLLSTNLIRLYLHALIFENKFDTFFIEAMELTKISNETTFVAMLEYMIEDIAYPRLKEYLHAFSSKVNERREIRTFLVPVVILVRLLRGCPTLHDKILKVLARELGTISNALDLIVSRMLGDITSRHDIISQAKEIFSAVNRLATFGTDSRHQQVITNLMVMLERHTQR